MGEEFNAEIAVADADGQPVADGTTVRIAVRGRIGGASPGVQLIGTADGTVRTKNGQATARLLTISREVSVVQFSSGGTEAEPGATAIAVVDTRGVAGIGEGGGTARWLAGGGPAGGFASWTGPTEIAASALAAALPEASGVLVWNGSRWVGYGAVGIGSTPGSADFMIRPGDTLWIVPAEEDEEEEEQR